MISLNKLGQETLWSVVCSSQLPISIQTTSGRSSGTLFAVSIISSVHLVTFLTHTSGLYLLWKIGIAHCDISPTNMMYYEHDGKPVGVLNDFDLAAIMNVGKRTPPNQGLERTGTAQYMAVDHTPIQVGSCAETQTVPHQTGMAGILQFPEV